MGGLDAKAVPRLFRERLEVGEVVGRPMNLVTKVPRGQLGVIVFLNVVVIEPPLFLLQWRDLRQDINPWNVERGEAAGRRDPVVGSANGGVDSLFMNECRHGRAAGECCGKDCGWFAVPVERRLEIEMEMTDLGSDTATETGNTNVRRRRDERRGLPVHDCRDHMQRLDYRALTRVVSPNHHCVLVKCHAVIVETTIAFQTKCSKHWKLCNGVLVGRLPVTSL